MRKTSTVTMAGLLESGARGHSRVPWTPLGCAPELRCYYQTDRSRGEMSNPAREVQALDGKHAAVVTRAPPPPTPDPSCAAHIPPGVIGPSKGSSRTIREPSGMVVVAPRFRKWPPTFAPSARCRGEIPRPGALRTDRLRPRCRVCSSELLGFGANFVARSAITTVIAPAAAASPLRPLAVRWEDRGSGGFCGCCPGRGWRRGECSDRGSSGR